MKKTPKLVIFLIFVTLIISQLTSCVKDKSILPYSNSTFALDTMCEITIYEYSDEENVPQLIQDTFNEIYRLEDILSRTVSRSDVYMINSSNGESVICNPETIEVIKICEEFSKSTNGLFDISIGKVSSLYNFRDGENLPEESLIKEGLNHIDYTKIVVSNDTVTLIDPQMVIDLGATAKGYISKKVAEYLESRGVKSAIINLGGNIITLGDKKGEKFTIGIKNPLNKEGDVLGSIDVKDKALITSGTYERFIEVNGTKYHHILDPKTGYSAETDLAQVTVIADWIYAAECDSLSTILLMLGSSGGLEYMKGINYAEAIFVLNNGEIIYSNENTAFERW